MHTKIEGLIFYLQINATRKSAYNVEKYLTKIFILAIVNHKFRMQERSFMQKSTVWFVKNVCKKIIVFGLSWAMIGSNIAYAQGSEDDLDMQLSTVQQQIKDLKNELKKTNEKIEQMKKIPPKIVHAPLFVKKYYFMKIESLLENEERMRENISQRLETLRKDENELLSVMESISWANQGYTQNKSGYNYPNLGNSPRRHDSSRSKSYSDDSFGGQVAEPLFEDFDGKILPLEFTPVDENGNPISTDDDVSCKDDEDAISQGSRPIAIPDKVIDDEVESFFLPERISSSSTYNFWD